MAPAEQYEILVLGSGAGGKLVAWHMAKAGRRTAMVEQQMGRRLLSEHRLHAEQERDLERKRRMAETRVAAHVRNYEATGPAIR